MNYERAPDFTKKRRCDSECSIYQSFLGVFLIIKQSSEQSELNYRKHMNNIIIRSMDNNNPSNTTQNGEQWQNNLSLVANEQTGTIVQRQGVTLLRPVFMNAVEVGYSYAHCDRDKKLNVRGVTIALWYFICRGHQAIALLPYCFKNYAEKSSRYSELMMLYRLNLIEFTPGYGSEKYTEVNRIMVNRAFETGGCIVARSQMQGITDNKANLINVVEQRLLMPTFNGDDVMFPIDGPLGRNGPTLKQTLECEQSSQDWRSCSEHQLLYSDQKHWLEKLAMLVPEKVAWTRMNQLLQSDQPVTSLEYLNPFNQRHDQQQQSQPQSQQSQQQSLPLSHPMPLPLMDFSITTSNPIPIRLPRSKNHHNGLRRRSSKNTNSTISDNSIRSTCGIRGHIEDCTCFELNHSPTSNDESENSAPPAQYSDELLELHRQEEEARKKANEQRKNDELLAKLSQIFGYSKSARVMQKYEHIRSFCQLVEKCLTELDEDGDDVDFRQPPSDDLIDFSNDVPYSQQTNASSHFTSSNLPLDLLL